MEQFIAKYIKNIKVNLKFKIAMLSLSSALVIIDLATKFIADDILKTKTIPVIDGFFNFALAYNTGVSFSMFNDLSQGPVILATIAIVAGILLYDVVMFSTRKVDIVGYALIASGAFANGIDRIMNGHVIDFLDFYYKNWHYPTFNLADCFIFIGVAILLLEGFFTKKAKNI
ncbi:MAG TPA: signal peptidase II [Alphaproteobacteria bacterium]|nr:signal peptidase II [Alphaproteobacteria bacterium]